MEVFFSPIDDDSTQSTPSSLEEDNFHLADFTPSLYTHQPDLPQAQALLKAYNSPTNFNIATASIVSNMPLIRRNTPRMQQHPAHFDYYYLFAPHQFNVVETIQPINDQILFHQMKLQLDYCKTMREEFDALISNLTRKLVDLF